MFARMIPAKRLSVSGKVSTFRLEDSPISYFLPSLEDIKNHLESPSSLELVKPEKGSKESKESDSLALPVYISDISNWLLSAVNSAAQVKARGGFTVSGTTPETLSVEIGEIPQSMEDLLSGERAGGPYMRQKADFLSYFKIWAEDGNVSRPQQYLRVLSRPSLVGIAEEAIKAISVVTQNFLNAHVSETNETEEEISTKWGVYLNALNNQLTATKEEEDWTIPE